MDESIELGGENLHQKKVANVQMFSGENQKQLNVKFSLDSDQEAPEDEFEQIRDEDLMDEYI